MSVFSASEQTLAVLGDVVAERERQDAKYSGRNTILEWFAVAGEEYGEVAKEVMQIHFDDKDGTDYRTELVQLAAVCVAAIESYDRNEGKQ